MGDGILDFLNLRFQAAVGVIVAGLDIRSHGAALKTRLSNLERRLFVVDRLLEELNVLLHVKNFLHNLLQMSLQFVSGVGGFGDSGVEGDVDGVELRPHLVGASAKRRLDVMAQTLARRAFLL